MTIEQSYKEYQKDRDEIAKTLADFSKLLDQELIEAGLSVPELPSRTTPEVATSPKKRFAHVGSFILDHAKRTGTATVEVSRKRKDVFRRYRTAKSLKDSRIEGKKSMFGSASGFREKVKSFKRIDSTRLGNKFPRGLYSILSAQQDFLPKQGTNK